MGTKGQETRDRVLEIAEQLILKQGFAGTSIDQIISEAGITKGGFFYHFDGKNALAVGLLERYRQQDMAVFGGLFERARELTEDPLEQMLLFMKLLSETMADLEILHPGCLVATFTYESQQVNQEVRDLAAQCVLDWRQRFQAQLDLINSSYQMTAAVTTRELADMLSAIIEGGIIVSRALGDPKILVQQLLQYRAHLRLLFTRGQPQPMAVGN